MPPRMIEDFDPAEAGNTQYLTGDYHGYFQEDVITVIAPVITRLFYLPAILLIHKTLDYVIEVQRDPDAGSHLYHPARDLFPVLYHPSGSAILCIYRPLRKITEAANAVCLRQSGL